jgi:hypothetical protein
MKKTAYIFLLISILISCSSNDDVEDFSVAEPEFFTSDIDLFWEVFDNTTTNFSSQEFQNLYVNKGTNGLKDYAKQVNLTLSLQSTLRSSAYLTYYNNIRENTLDLSSAIEKSKDGFSKLKIVYPNAKLFDVYFLVGALTAGGRVSNNGLLIAVEMFSKNTTTNLDDLSDWHQNVIRNKVYLPSIITHELIHKQQQLKPVNSNHKTVLEQSLIEGMADFVSHHLLEGEPFMNEHLHLFGDPIEKELWIEFKTQLDLNYRNTEWLYTGRQTSKGYPADMGYYIGYKILESYSSNFENLNEAIKSMLSKENYYDIFQESNYEEKFS